MAHKVEITPKGMIVCDFYPCCCIELELVYPGHGKFSICSDCPVYKLLDRCGVEFSVDDEI